MEHDELVEECFDFNRKGVKHHLRPLDRPLATLGPNPRF